MTCVQKCAQVDRQWDAATGAAEPRSWLSSHMQLTPRCRDSLCALSCTQNKNVLRGLPSSPCPEDLERSEIIYVEVNTSVNIRNWSRAGVMLVRDLAEQGGLWRRTDAVVGQGCPGHGLDPGEGWREVESSSGWWVRSSPAPSTTKPLRRLWQ